MNQAQLTGERICRQEKWWSPLPVPLWRIADEIEATLRMDVAEPERVVLAALRAAGRPQSFGELKHIHKRLTRHRLYDALATLVAKRQAVRSGSRGQYVYSSMGVSDADQSGN